MSVWWSKTRRKDSISWVCHWETHNTVVDPKTGVSKRLRFGGSESFLAPLKSKAPPPEGMKFFNDKKQEIEEDPQQAASRAKTNREKGLMPLRRLATIFATETKRSAGTVANVDRYVVAGMEAVAGVERPIRTLSRRLVQDYIAHERKPHGRLNKGCSDTTISMRLRALRSILNHAKGYGWIRENPVLEVDIPDGDGKTRRRLPDKMVEDVLARLPELVRRALIILANTGMRVGEAEPQVFDWKHVMVADDGRAFVMLDRKEVRLKGGKRGTSKAIPLPPPALTAMGKPRAEGPVLPGLKRGMIYHALTDACKALGIERKVTPHELRHTIASKLASRVPAFELMARFGWRDPKTAANYNHFFATQYVDAEGNVHWGLRHISVTKQKPPAPEGTSGS